MGWTGAPLTVLGSFRSSSKLVQTRFTSALLPDENGDLFLSQDPDKPRFTGAPIEEVDQNWESLTSGKKSRPSHADALD